MKKSLFFILLCVLVFSCQKEFSASSPNDPAAILPTLSTTGISAIANTTALSGGNISSDGGAAVTARGVCWSNSPGPVATGNHTTDGTGTGSYASNMTGLSPNTIYYVRAYATNSAGTAYGNELSFTTTTTAALPTVSTTAITNITTSSATGGGNVLSDGGAAVTARGVCWSVSANPLVTGTHTTDGSGTGTFTSSITALSAGTAYHVRAYATNSVGTAYGADIIFNTTGSVPADVYVAGYENTGTKTYAKYWTNGTPTIVGISDPFAYANDIFVSGTDVYVAGMEFFTNGVNYHWSAMIWKNGVPTTLAQTVTGGGHAEATSVFVSGSDVYVAGYVLNTAGTGAVAKLWKNGVATDLTTGATIAKAFSVFVSGTDVYVAGSEFNGPNNIAKYWKNGIATSLSSVGNNGSAESIFVSGTDVYVAGTESAGGSNTFARLWKNGVATALTNGPNDGYAHDVFVSGTDVYVAGQEFPSGSSSSSVAKTWKNGVVTILPGTTPASAASISVKGSDVYITGYEVTGTAMYLAKLWKNNVPTTLNNGPDGALATGIFVR